MRAKAEIKRVLSPVITGWQLDRTHPGANAPGSTLAPALQAEETFEAKPNHSCPGAVVDPFSSFSPNFTIQRPELMSLKKIKPLCG